MAIAGKKALVKVSSDSISFSAETFSTTDDKTYTIDDTTKNLWCSDCTITVYEDSSVTTEDYEINRLTGEIIFATVDGTRGAITADGEYLPLSIALESYDYTYSLSANNVNKNSFGDNFTKRTQTLIDVSGSLVRFYQVDSYFINSLLSNKSVIIELYSDSSNDYDIRIRALLSTNEVSAVVDGLVEESIDFEGTHDNENRVISAN